MDKKKLSIAIPASTISDTPHLREKTAKIGLIGRAAAIFRVNEIIVYPDNPKVNQSREMELIATLLAYIGSPVVSTSEGVNQTSAIGSVAAVVLHPTNPMTIIASPISFIIYLPPLVFIRRLRLL